MNAGKNAVRRREAERFGFPQVVKTTTLSGMTHTNEDAHRNLADDTRFRPLNEKHERFYYTDPETRQGRWLSLEETLEKKAELDEAAMRDADTETGETA